MQVVRRARLAERGAALVETALMLPLFMLVLFGVIWAVQSSVIAERQQIAVRFSGLVSNESTPYNNYSLYALYNAASAPKPVCMPPNDDAMDNKGQWPGPLSPSFFQPASQPSTAACAGGVAVLSGGSLVTPLVFIQSRSSLTSLVNVQSFLQTALPSLTQMTAAQNFFQTPDVPRLVSCYPELGTAVTQSVNHTPMGASSPPLPLPAIPPSGPLTVNTGCS